MKKINIKLILASALLMVFAGCKDSDFDSYKIQSVDSHGNGGSIISTAVTAAGGSEFFAYAVDASTSEAEYKMIPVALNAADVAPQDIHVTMVPDPESLAEFNSANFDEFNDDGTLALAHPELYYVMPGASGTPAFTLVDNGVVTIPKGSSIGYLKIKTTSANYFGATQYAYSYKISSVQESGYILSGNHYWGIVALIPKNKYDGLYSLNLTTIGWSAYGISDNLPGDYGTVAMITTGLTSCLFGNLVAGGNLQPGFTTGNATKTAFGATGPEFVFDANNKLIDVHNTIPNDGRNRAFKINPAALASENLYDPAAKTIVANYLFTQNGRPDCTVKMILKYTGSR